MRSVASGREALSLLEREAFDALVTDLRMPGIGRGADPQHGEGASSPHGPDRAVRGDEPDVGFDTVRCAHRYLAKPCDAEPSSPPCRRHLPCTVGWTTIA